jgi:hypothetical protein
MSLSPINDEILLRNRVLETVIRYVREDKRITLGPPEFCGAVGVFSYVFEGEDDLLHISVERADEQEISVEDAQSVVHFLLPTVPWGMVWLKPGTYSHHFYLGHDELLGGS